MLRSKGIKVFMKGANKNKDKISFVFSKVHKPVYIHTQFFHFFTYFIIKTIKAL